MELNQLPEGYDGSQKRRTDFESQEAKLAYDAKNLIELARKNYGKEKVTVIEALDLATRKDDDLEILRRYIAMEIKGKGDLPVEGTVGPSAATAAGATKVDGGVDSGAVAPEAAQPAHEKALTADQKSTLFSTFERRFASAARSKDIPWAAVRSALEAAGDKALYGLFQMENNGHEVGVVRAEKDGKKGFRFDSCSSESPENIRNVDYFKAEQIAEIEWGVPLMEGEIFEELRHAGVIKNQSSWDHLKTTNPGTKEKPGYSLCGHYRGINRDGNAGYRSPNGGFRCSLWVPKT